MTRPNSLVALGALAIACASVPAAAQTIYYEDGDYLYAVPPAANAPTNATQGTPVEPVMVSRPVVQGVPVEDTAQVTDPPPPVQVVPVENTAQRVISARAAPVTYPAPPTRVVLDESYSSTRLPVILPAAGYAQVPAYGYAYGTVSGAQGGYLPNGAQLVEFDRQAWLDECRDRLATYDQHDQARVIGALGGAVLGGVVGNRIADGNRLAGTLLGAGVGAAAGSVIGDSIDDRADRRARYASEYAADDYCAAYLDDYLARASNQGFTGTYIPGQQYMLVPVSVPVAQQVIYREVVTPVD